ncbi:MAG: hypothetical protein ACLTOM_02435 [Roseburia sp.]
MKKILCRFLAMSICFMFVFQGMVYAADVPEETTEQPQTEETTDTEIKEDIPESSIEESTETETEDNTEVVDTESTEITETEDTEESEETEREEIAICADPYGIATYSSGTIYPNGTNGHFFLYVQNGSVWGKYQVDVSIGSRCPNGINYYLSYNMYLIEGTDVGVTLNPQDLSGGTTDFYHTKHDNATSEIGAREYHLPFTVKLNKPGYHIESADTSGAYQSYFDSYTDTTCSFIVDTNGCGITNWTADGQFHNDTIAVKYVQNSYTINYNGNGATGGSTAAQTMLYDTTTALRSNGFVKNCTATFNGNGGTAEKGSVTAACPFIGWLDYNDITVNDTTYHWWTFDAPYYANTYSDIGRAYGYNKIGLAYHYDTYNVKGSETRQSSPVFNIGYYMNYGGQDLKNAFGSNKQAYISHWNANGYAEGRKGASSVDTSSKDTYPNNASVANLTTSRDAQLWLYAKWGNATVTFPSAARAGYTLLGWSASSNATSPTYVVGQTINISSNNTFYAVWKKSNAPTITRLTNVQDGQDAFWTYVYVQDNGDGIDRVQFPIWTAANGQDDLIKNWKTDSTAKGEKGTWTVNGAVYNYRYHTYTSSHNNEHGEYYTHAYAFDKYGGYSNVSGNFKFTYEITINHYQQNVSGSGYTLVATDKITGNYDSIVSPTVNTYTGFTSPATENVTVPVGGTTVSYYYSRNQYTVTIDSDSGIAAASGAGTYYYGAPVTVAINVKDGYKLETVSASNAEISNPYSFHMPAENVTITTTSSLLPVTVNIPRQLIMGQNSDFVISADNKGGEVIVEVPDKIEFTQSNKSQTIEGNISLSANKITADNPKIYGKITTNGFTAGTWKAAFSIKISFNI